MTDRMRWLSHGQYVVIQTTDGRTAQMFYRTNPEAGLRPVKLDLKPHRRAEVDAVWAAYVKAGEPFMYYQTMPGWLE